MRKATFYLSYVVIILMIGCSEPKQSPTETIESYYDLAFTTAERDSMAEGLDGNIQAYQTMHEQQIGNEIPPAFAFNPIPVGFEMPVQQEEIAWALPETVSLPENNEELAFYTVEELASLIKSRQLTSMELTKLYLDRIKKYGDTLQCVITLLEEDAMEQARKADEEIAAGQYRGPLHGIPYGIKDLLALDGYKTTWGAGPYKDQQINETATVVKKLDEAGAVLVAKLTLGALAMGDIWYGGVTKNPWNLEQGSSGSSAGSASATSAGLVGFSIGTETWGSIVSPSTRCGVTGLRPTYGRVSRTGAMALSWSMDKIGPICRSAKDCALVFNTIYGQDGLDQTLVDAPFNYKPNVDLSTLKIGYVKGLFDSDYGNKDNDKATLDVLRKLGANLQEVKLPEEIPVRPLSIILSAEAAAAFDELTRTNKDDLLVNQKKNAWPNFFRTARFIPAVEYIQASRLRYKLIQDLHQIMKDYDVIVTPSFGGNQLLMTNLSGHPCVVVPNGFNEEGSPTSISFIGNLFDEASILAAAEAYQNATDIDEKHPERFQ